MRCFMGGLLLLLIACPYSCADDPKPERVATGEAEPQSLIAGISEEKLVEVLGGTSGERNPEISLFGLALWGVRDGGKLFSSASIAICASAAEAENLMNLNLRIPSIMPMQITDMKFGDRSYVTSRWAMIRIDNVYLTLRSLRDGTLEPRLQDIKRVVDFIQQDSIRVRHDAPGFPPQIMGVPEVVEIGKGVKAKIRMQAHGFGGTAVVFFLFMPKNHAYIRGDELILDFQEWDRGTDRITLHIFAVGDSMRFARKELTLEVVDGSLNRKAPSGEAESGSGTSTPENTNG